MELVKVHVLGFLALYEGQLLPLVFLKPREFPVLVPLYQKAMLNLRQSQDLKCLFSESSWLSWFDGESKFMCPVIRYGHSETIVQHCAWWRGKEQVCKQLWQHSWTIIQVWRCNLMNSNFTLNVSKAGVYFRLWWWVYVQSIAAMS